MKAAEQSKAVEVPNPPRAKPSRLWLWFVGAFLLQLVMWSVWFVIASQHRVAEVPLATKRVSGIHPSSPGFNFRLRSEVERLDHKPLT